MYYRHTMDIKYPNRSDEHMITVKHKRDPHIDENYPFLKKTFGFKLMRFFLRIGLYLIAFPVCFFRYGLKVHGRKILRKNKALLKDGAITISNHVLMWDYICVLCAIRPHLEFHPAWKTNLEGPNGPFIRAVGGIPVPTGNIRAMAKFQMAIEEVLNSKQWFHIFPEGSMWFYYPDIRPLKPAIFKYAVRLNKPVIPVVLSFRPRKGLWKLLGKKPLVDVNIGEPILADKSLDNRSAMDKMHKMAYHDMQILAGIKETDSNYNVNQNIDEYVKTM